jgi:hypothetical protein
VASVYLVDGFQRRAEVCAKTSESGDDGLDRAVFRGIRQSIFESKVVLVKGVMLLRQHNPDKHRPAKPSGENG